MSQLAWLLSITSGVGVVGLVVFLLMAPTVAAIIFSSRLGCALVAAAIAAAVAATAASNYEHDKCAAERARIEAAAAQRDKDQGNLADDDAKSRNRELERQVKEHAETIASYEKLLASHPIGACALTADDLR